MALNLHNVMVASLLAGIRLLPFLCLQQMICQVRLDFLSLVNFSFCTSLFLHRVTQRQHIQNKSHFLNSMVPTMYPPWGSPGSPFGPGGPCGPLAPPGSPCSETMAKRVLMNGALKPQPQREDLETWGLFL